MARRNDRSTQKRSSRRGSTRAEGAPAAAPDAGAIAREIPRPAVAAGPDNHIVHLNDAAAELLGVRPDEVVGANLQEVLDARDVFGNRLSWAHSAFHEMVRQNESPEWFELDVRTASGGRQRVVVSIVIVRGPGPVQYELVYVMSPVRRRRRADEAIDRILAQPGVLAPLPNGATHHSGPPLTERQREVLQRLVAGHHPREIAEELGISVLTVRSHVRKILEAFEAKSQLEAVAIAIRDRFA